MELSCHFFWLLRPQIEWTIKCHKKKSLGSIKRALEWAIKVESEKPGDSKTYINDTQQQPHLLKRSDGGRKRLLHYSTLCAKKVLFCSDILKVFPDEENLSLINSGQFVYRTFLEHFNKECSPTQIQFVFKLTAINGSGCNIFWEWHQRYIDGCVFQKSTSRPEILMSVQMCFSNMCLIFRMMRTKISRCNISANKHPFGWSLSEKISCKRWRNPEKKIPANFRATQTSHHSKKWLCQKFASRSRCRSIISWNSRQKLFISSVK